MNSAVNNSLLDRCESDIAVGLHKCEYKHSLTFISQFEFILGWIDFSHCDVKRFAFGKTHQT